MKFGFHPINKEVFFERENKSKKCIWCLENNPKNIGHILSKSLLKNEKTNNKLKNCICQNCNSYWGNHIEDWLFKYSPLGHWKENIQNISNVRPKTILKNFQFIPNFVELKSFQEWIVVNHSDKGEKLPTQLFLTKENKFKLFHRSTNSLLTLTQIYDEFITIINSKNYTIYESKLLDDDIHPRLFVHNDKYILIAKNQLEVNHYINSFLRCDIKKDTIELIIDNNIGEIGEMHVHYKWSIKRYLSFTSKIAFEFLTLIKGADFTLNSDFDDLRKSLVSSELSFDNLSILSTDKGYRVKRLNYPEWILVGDISHDEKVRIPILTINNEDRFTYSIIIYKYEDFLCATVKLFEVEHSKIILAKTDLPLDEIFAITYNLENDCLEFYRSSLSNKEYDDTVIIPYFDDDLSKFN